MNSRATLLACLIVLLALALATPVWAGGWAVITLDELPNSVTAGEPITLRFAVRQHGRTLLPGLDANIHAENQSTGEVLAIPADPVKDQSGYYQAVLSFPSEGNWKWSIQVFSGNQPMPNLTVGSKAGTASLPPTPPNLLPIAVGISGLILAATCGAVAVHQRSHWAMALALIGLVVGGGGFARAAGNAQAEKPTQFELPLSSSQPEGGAELGRALFVAKGCVTCHANQHIESRYLDIRTDTEPDLTHYTASPEYLRLWLKEPTSVRQNTQMPNLELKEYEIEALIAFVNESSKTSEPSGTPASASERVNTATPVLPKEPGISFKNKCAQIDQKSSMLVRFDDNQKTRFQLFDPVTGLVVCGYDSISTGIAFDHRVFSNQNGMVFSSADDPAGRKTHLYWLDLATWHTTDLGVTLPGWTRGITVDPQGKYIFAAYGRLTQGNEPFLRGFNLVRIDHSQKEPMLEKKLDFDPRLIQTIAGGKQILLYGVRYDYVRGTSTSPGLVELRDAGDLSVIWEIELKGILEGSQRISGRDDLDRWVGWSPAIALSPDRTKLYIVHADDAKLTTVDLSQLSVQTVDIQPKLSLLERLLAATASVAHAKSLDGTFKQGVLSSDGRLMYITGYKAATNMDAPTGMHVDMTPLGLQVIRLEDGREIAHLDTPATEIDLSTDGKHLYLRGWEGGQVFTDVYTIQNLERIAHREGELFYPARRLDGNGLIISQPADGSGNAIEVLDQSSFRTIGHIHGSSNEILIVPWSGIIP